MQLNCLFKARDPSRAVIALKGKGVKEFLQGLFTNDVNSNPKGTISFPRGTAQYGCFLNGTGRTLFDGFITNISNDNDSVNNNNTSNFAPSSSSSSSTRPEELVLVDISADTKAIAMDHFKDFKLRRKIKIVDVSSHVGVFVETVRTAPPMEAYGKMITEAMKSAVQGEEGGGATSASASAGGAARQRLATMQKSVDSALVECDSDWDAPLMVPDPRYPIAVEGTLGDFAPLPDEVMDTVPEEDLPPPLPMTVRRGYKFMAVAEIQQIKEEDEEYHNRIINGGSAAAPHSYDHWSLSSSPSQQGTASNIAQLRAYRAVVEALCGAPSGPRTFAPNKGLPFEGNIDQLKAVSFDKGCYLGQELTHRTHVMLVSRKRVVPIVLGHYATHGEVLAVANGIDAYLGGSSGGAAAAAGAEAHTATTVATTTAKKARLTFDVNALTLSGIDFTVGKDTVWGAGILKGDTEYILPSSSTVDADAGASTTTATVGNKLYVDTSALSNSSPNSSSSPSSPSPNPKTLVAVGHVTAGQFNIGCGLVRLRYMDPSTRTMRLYIKRETTDNHNNNGGGCASCYGSSALIPQYIPATAFIPLWWDEQIVSKVLGASEVDE